MEKQVVIKIKDDAFVQDSSGRLTGEQSFDEKEANRLVDIGVAEFVVKQEVEKSVVPTMNSKKEDIQKYLEEKQIDFDKNSTKEDLLKLIEENK